ncbi:MAG: hypothetical protein IPM63_04500 [Acidobacteriota bacterium]|nr:MAG: hypothetical protein IPM63_04500 [Acidobacteriota bacterium]
MEPSPRPLAKLEELNVREAWQNEAYDFTPWLAENLEFLGEAIGLPLEAEGSEVAVETFSADILAKSKYDDTKVLIENQLEVSDHLHLGQILTYVAGLEAEVVVWVASGFRDAHLSAINWLNEKTENSISFFAVTVKVVRIGDSPLAPVFEVVARPNEWERYVHSVARKTSGTSEIGLQRQDFWEFYVARFEGEGDLGGPPSRLSNRYHNTEKPPLSFSVYVAKDGVGVYVRPPYGEEAEPTFELLAGCDAEIREKLGVEMGKAPHFYVDWRPGDYTDPEQRPELADWMNDRLSVYKRVVLGALSG